MDSSSLAARHLALTVGASCLFALTLSACGGSGSNGTGGGGFVTGEGGIATVQKKDRQDAPKLNGETLDGSKLDLAGPAYKGKVIVLNVWGSWCSPCRAEAPYFAKLSKRMNSKDVKFVGINTRDPKKPPAVNFEANFGIEYPSFFDPTGRLMLRFPKGNLTPKGIPTTLVLDRNGKIAARHVGAISGEDLQKMIDPLLKES
ncbi:TlpA family protein disulfide reductase [Streptomyces sp. NPDC048211]|uniref:TlpA family protein disulfide reductase n=1 Tax=Streptomyces sp. NPDC048211 TaxID=3365516 RepID=UPI0037240237